MAAMTPVKHFKTGRLGFVLRTESEWAWIYFPDVNQSNWLRANAFIMIPEEEVTEIQYGAVAVTLTNKNHEYGSADYQTQTQSHHQSEPHSE